ncbi:hypothetical protein VTK73DRAFT_4097 [Phialemonium thermophilum]|uniref:dCMP deaminase n=1 Tax=Phialemonium thermophilum TaxID=223376 RepID=A0ABR3WV77_9PEZI
MMFIGICGSKCAGKTTVAQYLVEHHGFQRLCIDSRPRSDDHGCSASSDTPPTSGTGPAIYSSASRELPLRLSHQPLCFPTAEHLLDFVTKRWRGRWVTTDIVSQEVLDIFSRRPFFLLISVDAPVTVRWQRFQRRWERSQRLQKHNVDAHLLATDDTGAQNKADHADPPAALTSLEAFVRHSDIHLYDSDTGHLPLMSRATVRLVNTSSDLAHLYATLGKIDLLNEDRLRPSWDTYFMALASLAAQRSNCMKRRVGCVLVRERRVVSTGYNGTPRGLRNCGEGGCGRCNDGGGGSGHGLATCLCIHAEENALLEAGRERIREGAILYCDTCPCLTCSIKIAQVGISEVVYSQGYSMDQKTAAVLQEAGVKLRQFTPPANGLIHLEKTTLY